MKKVVQDLTSGGIDWQREKWQSGLGSKFIHQGEKNAVKYADEVIVLSKGVQDYFKEIYKGQADEHKYSLETFINELPSRDEGKNLTHMEKFDNAFIEYENISIDNICTFCAKALFLELCVYYKTLAGKLHPRTC